MPKYVGLYSWTDQGAAGAKSTVDRYQGAKALVESMGGTIESILWTAGPYDIVVVVDAPDDETVAAVSMALASTGNLRSVTMRGFTEDEMAGVIAKMP